MTQKGNSINRCKFKEYFKGLILLILLFFCAHTFAQKLFKKSITSFSNKIYVEVDVIDHIDLIISNEKNTISIFSESENQMSQDYTVEERNGMVFIKSKKILLENNEIKIDKICKVQPVYTSYKVKIPPNKIVNVSIEEGNFYADHFRGNLNLKMNDGIAKLNDFKGKVSLEINGGNVLCSDMENVDIDATSNLGSIFTNINHNEEGPLLHEFKELYGKNLNTLNIRAISANIHLKAK